MIRLELARVWKKKAYLGMFAAAVLLQIFVLWYDSAYDPAEASLSEYKSINQALSGMTEEEKGEYLSRAMQDEESEVIQKVYREYQQVDGYDAYIEEVVCKPDTLDQISIFFNEETDSYSEKNIEKSAADHKGMEDRKLEFFPSEGMVKTFSFGVADILLILLSVYAAMIFMWEEKETGLWRITRATERGRIHHITSKIVALTLHVSLLAALQLLINYVWYGINTGFVDLTIPIQSLAPYIESDLCCNLLEMMGYVWGGKILLGVVVGFVTMLFAQLAEMVWLPWLGTAFFLLGEIGCYELIPLHSRYEGIRYASFWGLLHGNELYGGYANMNWFGTPIHGRTFCILFNGLLLLWLLVLNVMVFLFFFRGEIAERRQKSFFGKSWGNSLLVQEMYKIFVMNQAILVMSIFFAASWYLQSHIEYRLSANEKYYQEVMLELEGKIDEEKEALIYREQERFDQATEEIDRIDRLVAAGELGPEDADYMKSKYESVLSFYPQFEKVLGQFTKAREDNLPILYDTGYQQLFWLRGKGDDLLVELLLATVAMILGFGSMLSLENERGTWMLLQTTYHGKKKVVRAKGILCGISAMAMGVCSWIFRFQMIDRVYPMGNIWYPSGIMSGYYGPDLPLAVWCGVELVIHVLLYVMLMSMVFVISGKRQRTIEVYIFSAMVMVVPLLLFLVL